MLLQKYLQLRSTKNLLREQFASIGMITNAWFQLVLSRVLYELLIFVVSRITVANLRALPAAGSAVPVLFGAVVFRHSIVTVLFFARGRNAADFIVVKFFR